MVSLFMCLLTSSFLGMHNVFCLLFFFIINQCAIIFHLCIRSVQMVLVYQTT